MSEMSPLLRILVTLMQKAAWGAAGLLVLFAGLILYQRRTADGFVFQPTDTGFFSIIGVLLLIAVYLIWATRRELR